MQDVARGIGLDNRIGSKFLHAGPGLWRLLLPEGHARPDEDRAATSARRCRIVETVVAVNDQRKRAMARKVIAACGGSVRGKTIAVLGLTFKPNTDDMRDAPSLAIIPALQDAGAKVRAYDPRRHGAGQAVLDEVEFAERCLRLREGRRRARDRHGVGRVPRRSTSTRVKAAAEHARSSSTCATSTGPTTWRGTASPMSASAGPACRDDDRAARNGRPDRRHLPVGHPPVRSGRIGVLLLNLGTPDGTGYWPMRRYLKEFLSDRRVIEVPRWKWWPILNLIILTVRPGRKGSDYEKIWNKERNEGPLKTITRSQAEKLGRLLGDERIVVDWAMRYANPATADRARRICSAQGCDRILLVPLYPQYAAATTATACDEAFRALMRMRWQPAVRVAPPYYDDPVYIDALAASIRAHLASARLRAGGPARLLPRHAAALPRERRPLPLPVPEDLAAPARALGWAAERWHTTFQSRFGNEPWLQPYTIEDGRAAGEGGRQAPRHCRARLLRRLPGDAGGARHGEPRRFLANGGEKFAYVPASTTASPACASSRPSCAAS